MDADGDNPCTPSGRANGGGRDAIHLDTFGTKTNKVAGRGITWVRCGSFFIFGLPPVRMVDAAHGTVDFINGGIGKDVSISMREMCHGVFLNYVSFDHLDVRGCDKSELIMNNVTATRCTVVTHSDATVSSYLCTFADWAAMSATGGKWMITDLKCADAKLSFSGNAERIIRDSEFGECHMDTVDECKIARCKYTSLTLSTFGTANVRGESIEAQTIILNGMDRSRLRLVDSYADTLRCKCMDKSTYALTNVDCKRGFFSAGQSARCVVDMKGDGKVEWTQEVGPDAKLEVGTQSERETVIRDMKCY